MNRNNSNSKERAKKGEGIRGEGDWWEYTATAEGKVVVEARGLAGNVTRGDFVIK